MGRAVLVHIAGTTIFGHKPDDSSRDAPIEGLNNGFT